MSNVSRILAALIVACGLASAGFLGGQSLVESRLGFRTVTVKGLAEREVKSNLGFWPIRFTASGPSLETARGVLEKSERAVAGYLSASGFPESSFGVQNIQVEDRMAGFNAAQTPAEFRFVLTEDLLVRTGEVERLASAARNVGDLLKAGVAFASDSFSAGPSYVFTDLASVKRDMLAEAAQRAREAAEIFATESGARVGSIQNASQGVIEIRPAVEIPGERPEKQIDKIVRVVTTVTWFLLD